MTRETRAKLFLKECLRLAIYVFIKRYRFPYLQYREDLKKSARLPVTLNFKSKRLEAWGRMGRRL